MVKKRELRLMFILSKERLMNQVNIVAIYHWHTCPFANHNLGMWSIKNRQFNSVSCGGGVNTPPCKSALSPSKWPPTPPKFRIRIFSTPPLIGLRWSSLVAFNYLIKFNLCLYFIFSWCKHWLDKMCMKPVINFLAESTNSTQRFWKI